MGKDSDMADSDVLKKAKTLLEEALTYGQFSEDFNEPQAKNVREAIRTVVESWATQKGSGSFRSIPEGWRLVRAHPTRDQISKGRAAMRRAFMKDEIPRSFNVWHSMLAEAPTYEEPSSMSTDLSEYIEMKALILDLSACLKEAEEQIKRNQNHLTSSEEIEFHNRVNLLIKKSEEI